MDRFTYVSTLPVSHREELESLLFFNQEQAKFSDGISRVVEDYGLPEIQESGDALRVVVSKLSGLQCLFALDQHTSPPGLAGLTLFYRENPETLVLLHLAIAERFCARGDSAGEGLAARMVGKVVEVGRRLKGVHSLRLLYREGLEVPLRPASADPGLSHELLLGKEGPGAS